MWWVMFELMTMKIVMLIWLAVMMSDWCSAFVLLFCLLTSLTLSLACRRAMTLRFRPVHRVLLSRKCTKSIKQNALKLYLWKVGRFEFTLNLWVMFCHFLRSCFSSSPLNSLSVCIFLLENRKFIEHGVLLLGTQKEESTYDQPTFIRLLSFLSKYFTYLMPLNWINFSVIPIGPAKSQMFKIISGFRWILERLIHTHSTELLLMLQPSLLIQINGVIH